MRLGRASRRAGGGGGITGEQDRCVLAGEENVVRERLSCGPEGKVNDPPWS